MKVTGLNYHVGGGVLVPDISEKLAVKAGWIVDNLEGDWYMSRTNLDNRKRLPVVDVVRFKMKSDRERFMDWLRANGYQWVHVFNVDRRHIVAAIDWCKNYAHGVWVVKGVPDTDAITNYKYRDRQGFKLSIVEEVDAIAFRMYIDDRT